MFHFKRIQTKIFVYLILAVLIPLIILGAFSYFIATKFFEEQVKQNQTQTIHLIGNNIKQMLDDVTDISSYIATNESIQTLLSQPKTDSLSGAQQTMFNYLSNLRLAKKYISFLIIYGENDFLFRDFNSYYRQIISFSELKNSPTYVATAAKDGEPSWEFSSAPLFTYTHNYNEVMIGRRIVSIYDHDYKLGMLFMGIDREYMGSILQDIQISKSTSVILFDDNFNLVAGKQQEKEMVTLLNNSLELKKKITDAQNTAIRRINGRDYYASSALIPPYGWNIVSLTPLDDIQKQHEVVLRFTVIMIFFLLLVTGLISAFLSRSITRPIKSLLRSMNSFKMGNFNQQVEVYTKDEIGLLGKKYNEMAMELNELIQKVYISRTNQKIIELKTLQAQIEPHFLYNTLDFIFLNTKMKGDHQSAEVVKSLSQLFRISLNRGKDYYTLEKEIQQIKAYIQIQHARFPLRFRPEYDIDPAIKKYYTMKLLLQPIVENAIIHAFERTKHKEGMLRISGYVEEESILIAIEDNGIGMPLEKVNELLTISDPNSSAGYGIRNVNERLCMIFGMEHRLDIQSAPGKGTKVTIRLPMIESEERWKLLYENHGDR